MTLYIHQLMRAEEFQQSAALLYSYARAALERGDTRTAVRDQIRAAKLSASAREIMRLESPFAKVFGK